MATHALHSCCLQATGLLSTPTNTEGRQVAIIGLFQLRAAMFGQIPCLPKQKPGTPSGRGKGSQGCTSKCQLERLGSDNDEGGKRRELHTEHTAAGRHQEHNECQGT